MKSILYVGAALMLGASLYGFADYRNSKSSKEFKELYKPKAAIDEVAKPKVSTDVKVAEAIEPVKEVKIETVKSPQKPAPIKRTKPGKKKLTYKLFSRAAPPREIIEREAPKVEKQ